MYKLLKKPFFGRFMVKWRNPLSEEEQKEWQIFRTQSKSGGVLVGMYAPAKITPTKACIVLGHPMGKEAKGYFLKNGYTELLRNNGYDVVVFDINGFGESSHGNFSYFEDIVAIGIKAKELVPHLPIAYHGISLGGQWATISFADKNHCYDCAIIESAATTLDEFWIHFPLAYRTLKASNLLMPGFKKKISMIDRIKEAHGLKSILFIYSKQDEWTPPAMGARFQQNCPIPSELWVVDHAKHASIMRSEHKEEYQTKIVQYFDAHFGK